MIDIPNTNLYLLVLAITILFVFASLRIRLKIFVAFLIMTQCFDLAPRIILGKFIWDYGAILLLFASFQLVILWLMKPSSITVGGALLARILWLFIAWLFCCLLYSVLIYRYPVLETLKVSRQMIIGYLSIFIFLTLFAIDKDAFKMFTKWLYIITFPLLIAAVIQYIVGKQLLFGLHRDYAGITRYLPSFLPISLFYLWYILSKYFAGVQLKKHEVIYGTFVLLVTAFTYTRGLYIAVLFSFLLMLSLLLKDAKVRANKTILFFVVSALCLTTLLLSGLADRVFNRAISGLELILTGNIVKPKIDQDTYSGRMMLLKERLELVAKHNPILGYGFIHEENVPKKLRSSLKYGSVITVPEMVRKYQYGHPYVLALYSADIGWANIVIATGFTGLAIFLAFILTFVLSYGPKRFNNMQLYHFHLAFYLQIITLLLLMFNGSPFTSNLQIPGFLIAGYLYCKTQTSTTT